MRWTDSTRRAKGESKTTEPQEWTLDVNSAINVVLYHAMGDTSHWWVHCYATHIDGHKLEGVTVDDAKQEAIGVVKNKLTAWTAAVDLAMRTAT